MRSPGLVAGVTFELTLPWLLFALPAGALADRVDRRRAVIAINLSRAVILGLLATLAVLGQASLWTLFVAALVLGSCETFADTMRSSLTPAVVSRGRLEWANTRLVAAETVLNEFVGPPLGGALVAIGIGLALFSSTAAFVVAACALVCMRGAFRPRREVWTSVRTDIADGVRYVWNHEILRAITIMVAVMAGVWTAWLSVLAIYVVTPGPGGISEYGYGFLLADLGIGSDLGALLVTPLLSWIGRRGIVVIDVLAMVMMLAVPALTAQVWVIGAATPLGGLGSGMWSVAIPSLRQRIVPDELLGRANGVSRFVGWGTAPLGARIAGVLAELVGVRAVFACGAILTVLLLIPLSWVMTRETLMRYGGAESGHSEND